MRLTLYYLRLSYITNISPDEDLMDKPLSYSGYGRYMQCPQYYKYNDIDKIKAGKDTSALLIGKILDDAVGALLSGNDNPQFIIETGLLEASEKDVEFYADDLDFDLVDEQWVIEQAQSLGWRGDDIRKAMKSFLQEQSNLSPKQKELLRVVVWSSLEVKVRAMYDSFKKWIYPQIDQIHDIQLHLDDGITHGYLDFTATLKDGRKVLFDLKTSKMPYTQDKLTYSPQLSLYAAMHGYEYIGYIVLNKSLNKNKQKTCMCGYETSGGNRKKCPDCGKDLNIAVNPTSYSQIMVIRVPKQHKELTKQALHDTIKAIDAGHFPRNLNACNWLFGKPCPYRNKCWNKE